MRGTKITKDRLRNHFTYNWWKYLLVALVAVFGWDMVFTTTAYRPPKDRRLDGYIVGYSTPEETLAWLRDETLALLPQMEDSSFQSIVYTDSDNYYGTMQLTTYMGAGEGDVMLLPRERFDVLADGDAFLRLDDAIANGVIDLRGIDVTTATLTLQDGEAGVYGIPADELYGLLSYGIMNEGFVLCVMSYSETPDEAAVWCDWLIETMLAPRPEGMAAPTPVPGSAEGQQDIPSY